MFFHIEHTTEYVYSAPATESFSELRLRPRDSLRQKISRHQTQVQPAVPVESYLDYFGNYVETVSVPFRHHKLIVTSACNVTTHPFVNALTGLDLTISEARLLYKPRQRELHDFLRPSPYITFSRATQKLTDELLPVRASFSAAVLRLNHHIFTHFKYRPGATNVATTVPEFLRLREGVCQDFAHLTICLLRHAGIPARYVSGYIETDPLPGANAGSQLIGATASHAWVEVFTPNGFWVGLDPTNDMLEGERHVQIGIGRDYADVPPLQGIFKGADRQSLSVQVRVRRAETMPERNGV